MAGRAGPAPAWRPAARRRLHPPPVPRDPAAHRPPPLQVCLLRDGRVVHVLATGHGTRVFPRVAHARPLVAAPSHAGGDVELALWGFSLGQPGDELLARSGGAYLATELLSLDAEPAWGGLQRLVLRVRGAPAGPLTLEVMRGGFVSASKTVLVSADAALAREVRTLETEAGGTDLDALARQLGDMLALGSGSDAEARGAVGRAARRLLPFVLQRRWAAATALVLSRLDADLPAGEAMAQADVMAAGTTGMPILQLAVRSQRPDLVAALLAWAASRGLSLNATTPGRRGLTALHLAALVPDGGEVAGLLTRACPDALAGWGAARSEDGQTPLAFAEKRGSAAAVERHIAARQYELMGAAHKARAASAAEAAAAPASPTARAAEKGAALEPEAEGCARAAAAGCSNAGAEGGQGKGTVKGAGEPGPDSDGEEEELDELAAQKAAAWRAAALTPPPAQSALLTFRSPELEGRFARWFSTGQVRPGPAGGGQGPGVALPPAALQRRPPPCLLSSLCPPPPPSQLSVDLAFMLIALLSQAAWVMRWSGRGSPLAAAMLALMAINGAMMAGAALRPAGYVRRREGLALAYHAAHKLVQLLVTVLPPAGAVYSPTFNPTVALVESSGLAQARGARRGGAGGGGGAPAAAAVAAAAACGVPRPAPPRPAPPRPTPPRVPASSLQVAMLSFGLKLRFSAHLLAATLHLLAAWAAAPAICSGAFPGVVPLACTAGLGLFQVRGCCAASAARDGGGLERPHATAPQVGMLTHITRSSPQAVAVCALPCALVYCSERRSRRVFLETSAAVTG